jgi:glycosyltransferase involved in cell wall biosynthesis
MRKTVRILGCRGIPAAHGGFETFAEQLAPYLVERGWHVVVYCQDDGPGASTRTIHEDSWKGVDLVHIPIAEAGPRGTIRFDWTATRHAARSRDLCLTLGYNTAALSILLRLKRIPHAMNMDGMEWTRAKWGKVAKAWLWMNDWLGCWLADHLIADHPEIRRHLLTRVGERKITMIPYGAPAIHAAPAGLVQGLGLQPGRYLTFIARPEPENSLLEIVQAFSSAPRDRALVVLGNFDEGNRYHRRVLAAASSEVKFLGAIYDKPLVQALRFHAAAHLHGHQVGGTNPSLIEALGAGCAVFAHDNRFNRWVAGDGARYFDGAAALTRLLNEHVGDESVLVRMRAASRARFEAAFTWPEVLRQYEDLLGSMLEMKAAAAVV